MHFPTDYQNILRRINNINPIEYRNTRNYTEGDISYLSPYISRGVISTKQVVDTLLTKGYDFSASIKFIQQLAWREYFQRAWQFLEDDMFDDIRHRYTGIRHKKMPIALTTASTGIESVDNAIRELYETGYMHNHLRMYTASIASPRPGRAGRRRSGRTRRRGGRGAGRSTPGARLGCAWRTRGWW